MGMKGCPICKALYQTDYSVCPKDGAELRPVTELEEGAVLRGKYQILSLLGRGGMGSVYKARNLAFHELCALKVVKSSLLDEPEFLQRFRSEALVMRRLRHPNAVQVQDLDETEDGRPFIVMEYVEGEGLDTVLAAQGPLDWRPACRLAAQVAAALAAAHRLGIIHRDIKPSNILVVRGADGAEIAKVLDFGVAKIKEQGTLVYGAPSLTGTGVAVGTPAYMSPEQAKGLRGDQLDGRSDLYSLGVTLFELLTGRLPFSADTPVGLLLAQVQTPPTDPRQLRADLPDAVVAAVLRALEKDPARRFATAEVMQGALETCEKEPGHVAVPTSSVSRVASPPKQELPEATAPAAPSTVEAAKSRDSTAAKKLVFCRECGAQIEPQARFCKNCGAATALLRKEVSPTITTAPSKSRWVYAVLGLFVLSGLLAGFLLLSQRSAPTGPGVETQPTAPQSQVNSEKPAPVSAPPTETKSGIAPAASTEASPEPTEPSAGISAEADGFLFVMKGCVYSVGKDICSGSVTNKAPGRRRLTMYSGRRGGHDTHVVADLGDVVPTGEFHFGAGSTGTRGGYVTEELEPELPVNFSFVWATPEPPPAAFLTFVIEIESNRQRSKIVFRNVPIEKK